MSKIPTSSSYSSDDSSTSSSDDEDYLMSSHENTGSRGHGVSGAGSTSGEDREAMIRRKLLESFYGTASAGATTDMDTNDNTSKANMSSHGTGGSKETLETKSTNTVENSSTNQDNRMSDHNLDLDSPSFSAVTHTTEAISTGSTYDLLNKDENLALSIRTLDSTMQTLVYENYTKFIDATDAIRSIGQSVHTSSKGLEVLGKNIASIYESSKRMDESLRESRNNVAEKLRVRRLVSRLRRLLELPHALRRCMEEKKYRMVVGQYVDAMEIVSRHSEGFESLKSIEMECRCLVRDMVNILRKKMFVWCFGENSILRMRKPINNRLSTKTSIEKIWERLYNDGSISAVFENVGSSTEDKINPRESEDVDDEKDDERYQHYKEIKSSLEIKPPESISEILECAGALLYFSIDGLYFNSESRGEKISSFLTETECKSMALECCTKFLESILDDHAADIEEAKFRASNNKFDKNDITNNIGSESSTIESNDTFYLAPNHFLDSMLEAATLYGVIFRTSTSSTADNVSTSFIDEHDKTLLNEYALSWFHSFIAHVRMALREINFDNTRNRKLTDESFDKLNMTIIEDEEDASFAKISDSLSILLRSVRETASGLALPEVGLDMDVASTLVENMMNISESMLRRRVAQKFSALKTRILNDCIAPFCKKVLSGDFTSEYDSSRETSQVIEIIRLANIALSDGMQLVDDTIRSILSPGSALGTSNTSNDFGMMKAAVLKNARSFAIWLAGILEVVSGFETCSSKVTLEVWSHAMISKTDDYDNLVVDATKTSMLNVELNSDSRDELYVDDDIFDEDTESSHEEILLELDRYLKSSSSLESNKKIVSIFTLSIVEMCRLSQRNIVNNINQSISASIPNDGKIIPKSNGIFSTSSKTNTSNCEADSIISSRFRLASSRALSVYSTLKATDAIEPLCEHIFDTSWIDSDCLPTGPSNAVMNILRVAKDLAIECADAFGGEVQAGPVPKFTESDTLAMIGTTGRMGGGAIKGLQLDVARMFTQKVQIYQHPSQTMEFTRNGAITLMFKSILKAWVEHSRCCTFTSSSYRQTQVDIEFLRFLLPHYVEESSIQDLCTLLNDIVLNIGERCEEPDCVGLAEYYDADHRNILTPQGIAIYFLELEYSAGSRGVLDFLCQ